MPLLNSCSVGLVATALVALLLLPAQYYVPELAPPPAPEPCPAGALSAAALAPALAALQLPTLDLVVTAAVLAIAGFTYLCEWIQRKLMERRIIKLNQYLGASVERLRAWDAQQEQLEATLKMVQNATSEYNLLLYLMLRQHRCLPAGAAAAAAAAAAGGAPGKHLDDAFARAPAFGDGMRVA